MWIYLSLSAAIAAFPACVAVVILVVSVFVAVANFLTAGSISFVAVCPIFFHLIQFTFRSKPSRSVRNTVQPSSVPLLGDFGRSLNWTFGKYRNHLSTKHSHLIHLMFDCSSSYFLIDRSNEHITSDDNYVRFQSTSTV